MKIFKALLPGILLVIASVPAVAAQITPNVKLDTDLRFQASDLRNSDLGTHGAKNIGLAAAEAKFKLTADLNAATLLFWEGRAVGGVGRSGFQSSDTGRVTSNKNFLEWRQSYLEFKDIGGSVPSSIRVGRQKVVEPYGLWYNENFDAVYYTYDKTFFKGSLIGGQNLTSYRTGTRDFNENDEDLARVLAEGSWQYYYDHFFETRVMFQDDHSGINVGDVEDASDLDTGESNLFWAGVRAAGKTHSFLEGADKIAYRADLMIVNGDEDVATYGAPAAGRRTVTAVTGQDVHGWGFDAAVDVPLPNMKPLMHLGYAFGSGDGNSADTTDHAFRQSGMEGNFGRFGALSENTDNYGTVLRPDLSNIHVVSAGFTMPVMDASNMGAIYRYYRLDHAATSLASSGVSNVLNGTDRDLGQGVDLLFNMDVLKDTNVKFGRVQDVAFRSSLGFFRAGDAFGGGDGNTAVRGLVELKVGF